MLPLQPYEYFTLFIQLDNHTDTERDNYYVQSVIRNARTSELMATINLDSKGEGEYSKPWQVPADPSGLGLYIKVVTTVYEDANYTIKVPDYGQEGDIYLIADRQQPHGGGGGVDYKKIQAMIDGAISEIKFPESQTPSLDLSPILGEISGLYTALEAIPRYKDSAEELNSIRQAISGLSTRLEMINQPEKELDLSPITEKLSELSSMIENVVTGQDIRFDILESISQKNKKSIKAAIKKTASDLSEKLDQETAEMSPIKEEYQEVGKDYRGRPVKMKKNRIL